MSIDDIRARELVPHKDTLEALSFLLGKDL
jgi:hypothetical protein